MTKIVALCVLAPVAWLCAAEATVAEDATARQPNIIFILADDLGYGDLSCYGQAVNETPNIDTLAAEGMRFTQHYAGSTVCAPSRCSLMTGLHTGHCRIRGNGPGQLRDEDVTFGELLRDAGYATGAFGKWGVGNPPPLDDPDRCGFDEFYGYVNMYHAHNYYPEFLVRNGKKVPLRNRLYPDWKEQRTGPREGAGVAEVAVDYAPELIADEMLSFIRRHADEPFLLYYALNLPHANNEGGGEKRIGRNGMRVPELGEFAEKDWPIQEKGFARVIQYIDQDVGNILDLLKELGIDEETLILFSSDNGPHAEGGHKAEFFNSNGPVRGIKRDVYDGGIRVPLIARWPGRIPAGSISAHISAFWDFLPTACDLAGIPVPQETDGISYLPTLLRQGSQKQHRYLYWEFFEKGGRQAVRTGNFKGVRLETIENPNGPIELYDVTQDIGEASDIAADHPEIVATIERIMNEAHAEPESEQ